MNVKRILNFGWVILLSLLAGCDLGTVEPQYLETARALQSETAAVQASAAPELVASATLITPQATLAPTRTPLPGASGPSDFPENVNPLTGLVVEDPARLARRPVSIKVNNYPRSNRPQWGLSLADIVYEYYHNNDLPRFHAIFYGQDASQVGPIRSARPFDQYLVNSYESIFVFASADSRILEHLLSLDFSERLLYYLDGDCPPAPVCRYEPAVYNYLIADTIAVHNFARAYQIDDSRPNLRGMVFAPTIPPEGTPLTRLFIRYSYSAYLYWEYDPGTGLYYRFQDTQEDISGSGEGYALLTDQLTGAHITAANVVVLVVDHFHQYYKPPSGGNPASEIVDMDFIGNGPAYVLRDGYVYELQWVRPPQGELVYLIYPDGSRFPFKPGNTWFQVVSQDSLLEKAAEAWRFQFELIPPR